MDPCRAIRLTQAACYHAPAFWPPPLNRPAPHILNGTLYLIQPVVIVTTKSRPPAWIVFLPFQMQSIIKQ